MSRPTETEIAAAMTEAQRLRAAGEDSHGLARTLMYLHHRNAYLSAVRDAVEHYLHSGLAEHEHALLVRALDQAAAQEAREGDGEREDLGLG